MKKHKTNNYASKCGIFCFYLVFGYCLACNTAIAQSTIYENFSQSNHIHAKSPQENIEVKFFDDIDEFNKELIIKLGTQANLWNIRSSFPQGKFLNNNLWNGMRWEPTESYTAIKISKIRNDLKTNSQNKDEPDLNNNNYILDLRNKCIFEKIELKDHILLLNFKNLDLITIVKNSINHQTIIKQYITTGINDLKINLNITPNQLNIFEVIPRCKNFLGVKKYIAINNI